MKRLPHYAIPPLLLLFASCSTGTDPGDCMSIECLPITYGFTIWEDRYVIDDSVITDYSASGTIESHTGIVERFRPRHTVYLNDLPLWNSQNEEDGDSTRFYLNFLGYGNRDDSIYVAPPGGYNVWNIFSGGDQVLHDSIRTPVDPIMIVSHRNGDTFDPDQDLVLRFEGDGTDVVSFNVTYIIRTAEDVFNLHVDDVTTIHNEVVIPASAFAEWSGEEFRLMIFWTQIHRNRFLNRLNESVSLNYTLNQQLFLDARP